MILSVSSDDSPCLTYGGKTANMDYSLYLYEKKKDVRKKSWKEESKNIHTHHSYKNIHSYIFVEE